VKVAIPHCRGKWFPITAIPHGNEAVTPGRNEDKNLSSGISVRPFSRANGSLGEVLS